MGKECQIHKTVNYKNSSHDILNQFLRQYKSSDMLSFYMNNVVFLPHFLIITKTIPDIGGLASMDDYANYISLLQVDRTMS